MRIFDGALTRAKTIAWDGRKASPAYNLIATHSKVGAEGLAEIPLCNLVIALASNLRSFERETKGNERTLADLKLSLQQDAAAIFSKIRKLGDDSSVIRSETSGGSPVVFSFTLDGYAVRYQRDKQELGTGIDRIYNLNLEPIKGKGPKLNLCESRNVIVVEDGDKHRYAFNQYDDNQMAITGNQKLYDELGACLDFQSIRGGRETFPTTPARLIKTAANLIRFCQTHKLDKGPYDVLELDLGSDFYRPHLSVINSDKDVNISLRHMPGRAPNESTFHSDNLNIDLKTNGDLELSYNPNFSQGKATVIFKADETIETNATEAGSQKRSLFSKGREPDPGDISFIRSFINAHKPALEKNAAREFLQEFRSFFTETKKQEYFNDPFSEGFHNFDHYSNLAIPQIIHDLEAEKDFIANYKDDLPDQNGRINLSLCEIINHRAYADTCIIKETNGDFKIQATPCKIAGLYGGYQRIGEPVDLFDYKQTDDGYKIKKYNFGPPHSRHRQYLELVVNGRNKQVHFGSDEIREKTPHTNWPNCYTGYNNPLDLHLSHLDPHCKNHRETLEPDFKTKSKALAFVICSLGLDKDNVQKELTTGTYKLKYEKLHDSRESFSLLNLDDKLLFQANGKRQAA